MGLLLSTAKLLLLPIALLLSFYGYGGALARIGRLGLSRWFYPALGVIFCLGISGPFILAHAANQTYLLVLTGAGLLCAAALLWHDKGVLVSHIRGLLTDISGVAWLAVFGALLLLALLSGLGGVAPVSDKNGYLVHVVRLVASGQYGPDPFNSRIAESSLGGHNLLLGMLHAMGLAPYHLRALERFVGPLLTLITAWGVFRSLGLAKWTSQISTWVLLVAVFVGFGMKEGYNLTGTFMSLPFYLLIIWVGLTRGVPNVAWSLFMGLCVASAVCLKTTHLPAMAMLLAAIAAYRLWQRQWRIVHSMGILGLTTIIFLSPWMLNLYFSNGTLLYPFLGKGYHGSQYGHYFTTSLLSAFHSKPGIYEFALALSVSGALLGLALLTQWVSARRGRGFADQLNAELCCAGADEAIDGRLIVIIAVALFTTALVLVSTTTYFRYSFATLFSLLFIVVLGAPRLWWRHSGSVLLATLICITALALLSPLKEGLLGCAKEAVAGIRTRGEMTEPIPREEVIRAQATIPAGERIMARMGQAYFLDFSRNEVWHLDIPGASSLPPGIPLDGGPEELAQYLRMVNVRYLIYSEADDGGHPLEGFVKSLESGDGGLWEMSYSKNIVAFDWLLRHLGTVCHVHCRHAGLVVFDTQRPAATPLVLTRSGGD